MADADNSDDTCRPPGSSVASLASNARVALQPWRASTYLALVAKGLRPVGIIRGKQAKGGEGKVALMDKIVWEAGPAARAPSWGVLLEDRRRGAMLAFDAFEARRT